MTRIADLLWDGALAAHAQPPPDAVEWSHRRERFEALVQARLRREAPRGAKEWGEFVDAVHREAVALIAEAQRSSVGVPSHRGTFVHPSIPFVPLDTSFSMV